MNEKFIILIPISENFVPVGLFDNKLASLQVMVWCRIGDKPVPEPMLTWFTEAYIWH